MDKSASKKIAFLVNLVYYFFMNTAKKIISQRIFECFNRIHNKTNIMDKRVHELEDGLVLHPAEVDSLVAIGNHPGINITELAKINGISKAAESKTVKKLSSKNITEKQKDKHNKKDIKLQLTTFGDTIFQEMQNHIYELTERIEAEIGDISLEQIDKFFKILNIIEEHLDSHIDQKI